MKKILFVFFILSLFFTSCAVLSFSSFKDAKTLGLGHLRAAIGIEGAPSIPIQDSILNDTIDNVGLPMPSFNAFIGFGLPGKTDIYVSGSATLNEYSVKLNLKKQLFGKLGFSTAMIPGFVYSDLDYKNAGYKIIGMELPFSFTFDLINFLFLTIGVEGGYYKHINDEYNNNFDFYNYGMYIMPEMKFLTFRISPGIEIKRFASIKNTLNNNTSILNVYDNQTSIYPFLSISYQF